MYELLYNDNIKLRPLIDFFAYVQGKLFCSSTRVNSFMEIPQDELIDGSQRYYQPKNKS